jgi:hypothetical protein
MKTFIKKTTGLLRDLHYDEKGFYYDTSGRPYVLKWDEVTGYQVLDVMAKEDYAGSPPILLLLDISYGKI